MTQQQKILLVEDDSLVAKVHTKMLQRLECEVIIAETGESALVKSKEEDFDLIFMDMGLPDISGDNVIARIRLSRRNNLCPIIVLTGFINQEIHQQAYAAGANKIFLKPITFAKLKQILETQIIKGESLK